MVYLRTLGDPASVPARYLYREYPMYLIHGTWIPDEHPTEIQNGAFYLWVETDRSLLRSSSYADDIHPKHLMHADLEIFLTEKMALREAIPEEFMHNLCLQTFVFPTVSGKPIFSIDMAEALGKPPLPVRYQLAPWRICCYRIPDVPTTFQVMDTLTRHKTQDIRLGGDLLFWLQFTRILAFNLKEAHIPSFSSKSEKRVESQADYELFWTREMVAETYETNLRDYATLIPDNCIARVFDAEQLVRFDREALLRHFAECFLSTLIQAMPFPARSSQQITRTLLYGSLYASLPVVQPGPMDRQLHESLFRQIWRGFLTKAQIAANFTLGFRLEEAPPGCTDDWHLRFFVASRLDPSLQLCLDDYWSLKPSLRQDFTWPFGQAFEQNVLLALGYAARISPDLWRWLATDKPGGCHLPLDEAFAFLRDYAVILNDAGYTVQVPSWWTPAGRQRTKLRLKVSTRTRKKADFVSQGHLSFKAILLFSYEVALGDQSLSQEEWEQLVEAKTPLVQFRGKWVVLDRENMQEVVAFLQKYRGESGDLTLPELLKTGIQAENDPIWDADQSVQEMLSRLQNKHAFAPIEDPRALQGILRDYQKRGVAWLEYLESLGLNPCLADEMGLGKSLTVLACLLKERERYDHIPPTLIVAPTSVLGNWRREIGRFAPQLRTLLHQGEARLKDPLTFAKACEQHDIVLTSFALARLDARLLQNFSWQRVVVDEAQNIKNPQAAQTRAILKLPAAHRVALTGTPVENRLRDLWSIFNFLNPGYLGKEAQFREVFELPIQKGNDQAKSALLKKMVEPFILRRVKTDKRIINDLPEKVEQKMYCTLSVEQASLYEALVKDVGEQLKSAKGIRRKGIMLSTLLKLKQICNHPAQFLRDGSAFSPERSHKFQRLGEMLEEVIESGESALVFTQFTEIGEALKRYLTQICRYKTFYLHGGTSLDQRDQMINEFQDPATGAAVFILSLRAGGVGLNLTKATTVFHFDRWWNPAVEDQATDRAFRIGQHKNVFVYKFVTIGTMEERIDAMIEDKKRLSSLVVGTDESWLTELDNETFQALITLHRSAVID
jgi:SNF2 family DNA or RNA helicase